VDEPQLYIGYHDQHGVVARTHHSLPEHLAHWTLTRTQFEQVPDSPLYRLTEPHHDGTRRTRQAVNDLRNAGLTVQADLQLDPQLTPDPPRLTQANAPAQHRAPLAEAARARSPQRSAPLTAVRGGLAGPARTATAPGTPTRPGR
jgi:hypothetical protein